MEDKEKREFFEGIVRGELYRIKRVLRWIMFDRSLKYNKDFIPPELEKYWKDEYWWIQKYLPEIDKIRMGGSNKEED